ncbi:BOI-related E3 ubiquitin-protein ligase 1-like isoform X2 [Humulus lupulus]|uniref:BOI-related E3 ubiquitin-protein ligase 1-like isoform X2 n=1 Tax=Humulus lupulus TaxID=3486 RepID=UPI002B40ACC1|nr:BOI-related E3 ubiquitin-protein ligase 1-like isoform X2 [Humulus lupulus]
MAVQAQYPSNILLLNRNGQEGHDYSLQQHQGGLFLDQSSMIFNNVGASNTTNNNPRKRGREASVATTGMTTPINPFSLHQSQPPQLIDLSQLHNQNQPNVVSTGLRLSFGEQQQQLQQNQNNHHQNHNLHHHQQQQSQQLQQLNQSSSSSSFLSVMAEDFASQIKQQRDEIDQFLQAQGEQLRRTLAEKRQRHYRALLSAAEEWIARRLREKEAEMEKATRRNAELEARAAQLSVEAQVWQAKVRAQEATAASLQAQLQQAIMNGGGRGLVDEGGVSCAGGAEGGIEGQAEDAESAYVDPDRVTAASGPSCKACRKRVASVVILPCRHLCLCTECDRVVQACPLCLSLRNSSVEVFLS